MTSDEFIYWFSGYMSAINERVKVPNEADWTRIRAALSKVSMAKHALQFAFADTAS